VAKGIPKVPLAQAKTALAASVSGVGPPSGISKPKLPLIDKRQNVGTSNVSKTRWPEAPKVKMGNHQ
jgi:hypothetical protein